jgi:hypothetical protein
VHEPSHEQTAHGANQKECPTFFVGMFFITESAVDLIRRDDNDKVIVAVFTIGLAISTIGLWSATIRLWEAGERQMELIKENAAKQSRDTAASINLARAEFISTHRPKLVLREAYAPLPPDDDRIHVHYSITNVGSTKAWIIHSDVYLELFKVARLMLIPNSAGKNVIPTGDAPFQPGETKRFDFWGNLEWEVETRKSYHDNDRGLFFVGHIMYSDELGTLRETAFRRRYNPSIERFEYVPVGFDHEYVD